MRQLAFLGFVSIIVGVCGDDGGPEISATQANVCSEIAEVACYNMYRCCAEGEIEDVLQVDEPRTEAQCRDDLRRRCERGQATFDWSIENERASFDAAAMNACLEAMVAPAGTCAVVDSMLPWVEACMHSPWTGLVPDGSTCYYAYECAGADSYCAVNRTCTALPGENQPCSPLGCASGLYCDFDTSTCERRIGEGMSCLSTAQCAEGLFCDVEAIPQPICTAPRAAGEPCTSSATCASAQCIPGLCAGSANQTCFADSECTGRCDGTNQACFRASDCGTGTCSVSGGSCTETFPCSGVGDTCVYPVACNQPDCIGDPVCAEKVVQVDYCEAVLGSLPMP